MSAAGEVSSALRSGVVSAMFDAGSLRDVHVGNEVALLQVYVAVRDANWATVPGELQDLHVEHRPDGFAVTFRSVHAWGDASFSWDARIEGRSGTVTFVMDGVAGADFATNRIGFCLLHPLSLAGTPVTIRTVTGERQMRFPTDISPHQPFPEMAGMTHPLGAKARLDLAFDGDLFETEDQRNWTDASYKTYCTPLRLPYPRQVRAGERIRQAVTLTGHAPART
ncbi:MAG: D-apionate lactonase, partial [Acidimicrobiales bacterium]